MSATCLKYARLLLALLALLDVSPATASHIVGGGFVYSYLGDTIAAGQHLQKYKVSLLLYQDCATGVADAINQDNPAFFTFYKQGETTPFLVDTSIYYSISDGNVAISGGDVSSPCGTVSAADLPPLCLLRKTFSKTYYLPMNTTGYTVVYQRCCRNSSILNILNPGDYGATYFCNIPASTTARNASAVFKKYPPQVMCNHSLMEFDHSATDADGDSLSYELFAPKTGADNADIKPYVASPPPFPEVSYVPTHSFDNPMGAPQRLNINAKTGIMSVTPNKIGRYLIGVSCKEWRGGILINETRSEFQWAVITCKNFVENHAPKAGENQTIMVGEAIHFNATGSERYLWSPAEFLDNPYRADPVGVFTRNGEFIYILYGVNSRGCNGSDTVTITVLEHAEYAVPNAFTPNNDGRNDILTPIPVGNSSLKQFRVFNRMGNLVFSTSTPGAGWDGRYNGNLQGLGVYFWSVEYKDNNGADRINNGSVTLLR